MRLRSLTGSILVLSGFIASCGQTSTETLITAAPIRPAYVTTVTESRNLKNHVFIGKGTELVFIEFTLRKGLRHADDGA